MPTKLAHLRLLAQPHQSPTFFVHRQRDGQLASMTRDHTFLALPDEMAAFSDETWLPVYGAASAASSAPHWPLQTSRMMPTGHAPCGLPATVPTQFRPQSIMDGPVPHGVQHECGSDLASSGDEQQMPQTPHALGHSYVALTTLSPSNTAHSAPTAVTAPTKLSKEESRRQRNRLSAARSRQRMQHHMRQMERQVDILERENRRLVALVAHLLHQTRAENQPLHDKQSELI